MEKGIEAQMSQTSQSELSQLEALQTKRTGGAAPVFETYVRKCSCQACVED